MDKFLFSEENIAIQTLPGTLRLSYALKNLVLTWTPYEAPRLIGEDKSIAAEHIVYILRSISFSQVKSVQRHSLEDGLECIEVTLATEYSFHLYFNNGGRGAEKFEEHVKHYASHAYRVRSDAILVPERKHEQADEDKYQDLFANDEYKDPLAFKVVSIFWKAPRRLIHPLTREEWVTFLGGQVMDEEALKRRIHYGGVDNEVRREVWPVLLGHHAFLATKAKKKLLSRAKKTEYQTMKAQWQMIEQTTDTQAQSYKEFSETDDLIAKDLPRMPNLPVEFFGMDSSRQKMRNILMTYSYYNSDLKYLQWMSALVAPIIYVMKTEADAFWCFVELMKCPIFQHSGDFSGARSHLLALSKLLQLLDQPLYEHFMKYFESIRMSESESFEDEICSTYVFCYPWIVCQLTREFDFASTLRLWEVLWTGHLSKHLFLYVCVAILKANRSKILAEEFPSCYHVFQNLRGSIDVNSALEYAEALCLCIGPHADECLPTTPPPHEERS